MRKDTRWGFVIDTDSYAGGFERPLCAVITGQFGECGVGQEEAEAFVSPPDINFEDLILQVPDEDNGCRRPVVIYPTPGYFNNGMGGHFKDGEDDKALIHLKQKMLEQADYSRKVYADKEYGEKLAQEYMKEASELTEVEHCSAYQSVLIYFNDKPSEKVIEFLKTEALKTQAIFNINIIGFRVVSLGQVSEETV